MNLYRQWKLLGLALALVQPAIIPAQMLDYGAVPTLTNPQGDQSAANQKLDYHTDLFTGRFNYRVPIEVPPGRGGSEPSIALQYNSSDGNGWCGEGWDLDMGYIQRETRHGVPMSNNGYSDSFGFIYSVAGQSGRLVLASDGTYRPEINSAFLKFVLMNDYWVVTDKSGRTYTFGSDGSKISAPVGAYSGTFKWYLSNIQDANGNQTTISYQYFNGLSKLLYPYQISYNANANNSALTNNCTVVFGLNSSRTDIPNSCISGQEISTLGLLTDIRVNYNNQQVRHYVLQYTTSPSTGRSLLYTVQEHGTGDNWDWPARYFYYSELANSFLPVQRWPITSQAPNAGNLTYTSPSTPNTTLIDMNGDGLPDWVSSQYNTPYTYYVVQTNTGSGFGPAQNWAVANETGNTGINFNSVNTSFLPVPGGGRAAYCKLVDINGDGLPDRVMCDGYAGYYFQVQTNTGKGFGPVQHWSNVSTLNVQTSPDWYYPGSSLSDYGSDAMALMVDMNGDGIADLLMLGSTSGQFQVSLNNGAAAGSFNSVLPWEGVADSNGIRFQYQIEGVLSDLLDMNGDGLPDRIVPGGVQLNLGAYGTTAGYCGHFDAKQSWGMTNNEPFALADWSTLCYHRQLIDMNGDGLPDLVVCTNNDTYTNFTSNANYLVYYNTGSGFATTPVVWSGVDTSAGPTYGLQAWDNFSTKAVFIDMNGDGLPDRVVRNNEGGTDCLLVQLNAGPYPDMLTDAYNGIGGHISVTYTNSTALDNSDGTRPRMSFPVRVVTSVCADGNMGPATTTTYNYHYGLYDTVWREFRGFGMVDATDALGAKTTTYFYQGGGRNLSAHGEYQDSRFKAGMPYDVITYGSDGLQYKETLSQINQVQVDPNGVYFPYAMNVFDFDVEPGASCRATLKQYTYDVTANNLAASTGNLLKEANLGEVTNVQYTYSYTDVADPPVYTTYAYAKLSNPNIIDKPYSVTVSSDAAGNNILRKTQYQYFGATGNLQEKSEMICPTTYANTFYTYDNYGNPFTITDPMGMVTTLNYDAATATFPWRKVTGSLTNTARYDPYTGNVLYATNEQGMVTANTYDPLLRLTNSAISTTPNGAPTLTRSKFVYNLGGLTISSFYASYNYVHEYRNDPSAATGYHETYTYLDGLGRPMQIRELSETNNQFRVTALVYNARGQVVFETYPVFAAGTTNTVFNGNYNCTWTLFDAIGRPDTYYPLASATFSAGLWANNASSLTGDSGSQTGPTSISYSDGSNPWAIVVSDALGKVHKYSLDAFGRTNQIVEVTSGGNFTTKLAYNPVGDLTNITDNALNSIAQYYNLAGQRVALADPDMGFWQYDYDLDGRLATQTDAKLQQTRLYYIDPNGRLTRREGWTAAGACVSTNTWTYDSNGGDGGCTIYPGQLYMVTDDEGWQKFSYDVRNRTLQSVRYLAENGNSYTNQFTFDNADRLISTAYPNGGPVVTNLFDGGLHLSQVKQVGGTSFYTAKGYNVMNQLNGISFGNGVATTFGYYTTTKRLKQILTTATGSITIQSFINRYDAVGNVIGLQDQVSSHTNAASATISSAVYDDLNRLTTATWSGYGTKTYGYNSVGNVLTNGESGVTNYVYGSIRPHAVRSANGTWFTYDQNGNAVFRGGQRLDYNVNNHLYRVINTNGVVTTFGYDANGARLWEQSSTNTLQVWIGNNYEEKNGQTLYHILANSQTVCTFDKTGTNVFEYYHPDYLTSTSLQTDKNGNQLQHYEYSAFGQTRYTQSTNVFKVSRLYTGQVLDDSTGLYYYNFRYYDPILARFMQPDDIIQDIFNPQTYNRYSYCVNNPLRFTDPSGHDPTYAMFFANSSIQNEVAVSRTLAPYAVGAIVATATAGVATPLLVSAGASTTFAAVGSGVIAGATGDLVSQGTQIGLGQRKSISGQEVAVSSLAGGALSGAASKLALLKATPGATPEATPTVTPQGQVANAAKTIPSKVDNLVSQIEQSGAKVKLNPKTANQEGNVTLDFGKDGRINIRVETHSLEPNGTPVRHANVETVTEIGGKKTVDNTHITQ